MAEIVTPHNRHLYGPELKSMFEMRYRVAVGELGWEIPGIQPGFDKDQFDTEDTIYALVMDETRSVQGCCRLNRTDAPHMLTEVFAHYCDLQPIPRSPHIFEVSRYFIERSACKTKERQVDVRQALGLAITEYILSVGGTHMTWLTHQALYNHTISVYDSEPLGLPREEASDNAAYIAAISRIDEHTWNRQRGNLRTEETHLTFQASALTPRGLLEKRRAEAA